jgi:hypothetical protein
MLIETGFTLARPLVDSWALLTDLERVAPADPDAAAPPVQAEPVDLGRMAGSAVLPKAAPALVAIGLALLALVLLRRRK